jgi:hypothetical protein
MRVWRHKNTAYALKKIQPTVPYPTDEWFAQEAPEPVYDGLTCPKFALKWTCFTAKTGLVIL